MSGATIEEDIAAWSVARPAWQRAAMQRLARGEALGDGDFAALAALLALPDPGPFGEPLSLADVPRGQRVPAGSVVLRGIKNLTHVNALTANQGLDFAASGMTVVYGDNGSGKSGYARLIKAVVRARDREEVRSNIFADDPNDHPTATIVWQRGDTLREVSWPADDTDDLAAVGFYDEACGDKYLTTDTEISYRPSCLSLLDGLVRACDGVRALLDRRLGENGRRAVRLPDLRTDTAAGRFLAGLSSASSTDELDEICRAGATATTECPRLAAEEARLLSLDPARERARLIAHAGRLEHLAVHLEAAAAAVAPGVEAEMASLHGALRAAEAATAVASAAAFGAEPLSGVGSSPWRLLWDAARRYAAEGAALDADFPDTSQGARCVLCQQELSADAASRLRRFDRFVKDNVQASLVVARQAWARAQAGLSSFTCIPADVAAHLEDLDEPDAQLAGAIREFLAVMESRQTALRAAGELAVWTSDGIPPVSQPAPAASAAAEQVRARASSLVAGDQGQLIRGLAARRYELEDASKLERARDDVLSEIDRMKERTRLELAKGLTATTGISTKIGELMRAHVTTVVRDRFTRETDRLALQRVTLSDHGVRKGALRHHAAFVGARQQAALPQVLSEGEQTALGLAGFFTEAYLDASRAALVLDDPVSSLDHCRRAKVAQRLVEFAQDRQVVVFTHDIAFVGDLAKAAAAAQVPLAERSVERAGTGKPGVCRGRYPWKARDVPERLKGLAADLKNLRSELPTLDQDAYETRTSDWGGRLSETWERILAVEVVGQVFDFGMQEAHPRMFRLLAKITDADDTDFQASYGRCSQWARRHDKSLAVNYVPPTIDEMTAELTRVDGWFHRVRKYKNEP
ncbi:MAG: hypothetical protein IT373_30310 [Polyangiaceae bacterium]|nr:hypothetical protein [Polyangiaceae bacterium]